MVDPVPLTVPEEKCRLRIERRICAASPHELHGVLQELDDGTCGMGVLGGEGAAGLAVVQRSHGGFPPSFLLVALKEKGKAPNNTFWGTPCVKEGRAATPVRLKGRTAQTLLHTAARLLILFSGHFLIIFCLPLSARLLAMVWSSCQQGKMLRIAQPLPPTQTQAAFCCSRPVGKHYSSDECTVRIAL